MTRSDLARVLTRYQFIKISGLSLLSSTMAFRSYSGQNQKRNLRIGLCGSWDKGVLAKESGCSYIEAGVASLLMPDKSDAEFRKKFEALKATQPLRVECFNSFLPKELKSVGDDANHEGIINYATTAFERAEFMGVTIIVFGSSGSRNIPEGFDRTKAKEQFISLCEVLATLAARHQITLAIEQLNRAETNFITTLKDSAEIVERVHHPNLKMMCDIFHALREDDPPTELVRYKDHLVHCHIAEKKDRTSPGVSGDDFKINYKGRVSLECNWKSIERELPNAVKTLQDQFDRA
jgi:sugar phosphate isomerase/epimerase